MGSFEQSQACKEVIALDSSLIERIKTHMGTKVDRMSMAFGNPASLSPLRLLGRGETNRLYEVGKTKNGLWVALRENSVYGRHPQEVAAAAKIYNSYGEEAEKLDDSPYFCIGGVFNNLPFLLVQDVSEGGRYYLEEERSGEKRLRFTDGTTSFARSVDLGCDEPYLGLTDEVQMAMITGKFDIEQFKYFAQKNRLNI